MLQVVAGIALSAAFVGLLEGGRARWLGLFLVVCFALLSGRALSLGAAAASASLDPLLARVAERLDELPPQVRRELEPLVVRRRRWWELGP
jgi:hypothetical protein